MVNPLRSDDPNPQNRQFAHFGVLNDDSQSKVSLFTSIVINILLGLTAIVAGAAAKKGVDSHALPHFVNRIGIHKTQAIIALVAISLGWLAHYFKTRWQYRYGVAEVCFAAVSAWNLAHGLSTQEALLSRWVALIASAYIAARGLGNIADAKSKTFIRP